jgi:hypothetical protein
LAKAKEKPMFAMILNIFHCPNKEKPSQQRPRVENNQTNN